MVNLRCCEIHEIKHDKIVESHILIDVMDLIFQTGVFPIHKSRGSEGIWLNPINTNGVDFFEKRLTLRGDGGVMLQIWDIGGQSISSKNLPNYIKGAHVIFICYDVTNRDSFDDLEDWLKRVHEIHTDENGQLSRRLPQIYIVGNKIDLIEAMVLSSFLLILYKNSN